MKTIELSKETLVGQFILLGHTSEGYFFGNIFNDKAYADHRFSLLKNAFEACEDSTCQTGSVELIQLPEDILLLDNKKDLTDDLLDEYDYVEIPDHYGYSHTYYLLFPMNECVVDYCDVEGAFLESL